MRRRQGGERPLHRGLGQQLGHARILYAEDAAEGVVLAAERYDEGEPVNLSSGMEISIRDLVGLIAEFTGLEGEIGWDASKPNGQPRRCLDTSRAREAFGFTARTEFREGLKQTSA